QEEVARTYLDRAERIRRSILNVARMGKFSSDRRIRQYADEVWDRRHDPRVGDAQAFDAVDAQLGVHDRVPIRPHRAGTDRMMAARAGTAHESHRSSRLILPVGATLRLIRPRNAGP